MTTAYSYVRFSSPEQRKGDSLRRQTEAAADWCRRNGARLDNSTTLHDLGKSAFKGKHRENPDLNALACFLEMVQAGRVVRGSRRLISSSSSDVIDTNTPTAWCRASSVRRSMSRMISRFLVMIATGWRNSTRTSRQRRVRPSFRSSGW